MTLRIESASPRPQYWLVRIPAPPVRPKVNHHKNKAYLIGQRRCAHSHFTQLSQHDRIQHANRRCYHILQRDRHRNGQNRFVKILSLTIRLINPPHTNGTRHGKLKNDPQDPFSKILFPKTGRFFVLTILYCYTIKNNKIIINLRLALMSRKHKEKRP